MLFFTHSILLFFCKLHGKKAISGVCTEKKRSHVCSFARKKSDLTCAVLHGKKAISRVQGGKMKLRIDLKIIIFMIIFGITKQLRIYIIVMFFCFLHELGHIIVGKILGLKIEKIEITPCGFSTAFSGAKKVDIIVALAGPAVSFMLAILFRYIELEPYIGSEEAVYSNLLILIFNLLPLYPLDGGRIFKGMLEIKLNCQKVNKIISKTSESVLIILTIISSIAVYYFKNIAIFLICIFLWEIIIKRKSNKTLDILRRK